MKLKRLKAGIVFGLAATLPTVSAVNRAPANISPDYVTSSETGEQPGLSAHLASQAREMMRSPVPPLNRHIPALHFSTPDPAWRRPAPNMAEINPYRFRHEGIGWQTGCLAIAIYYEARSESELGQIAVAQVVLNRVASRKYPNTICGVVYQNAHMRNRCQFSFACDGKPDNPGHVGAWAQSTTLAARINCGKTCRHAPKRIRPLMRLGATMRRSTHYHASYVRPRWRRHLERVGKIGLHIFYISKRAWS